MAGGGSMAGDLGGVVAAPWELEYVVCPPMGAFDNAPLLEVLDGDRRAVLGDELAEMALPRAHAWATLREVMRDAGEVPTVTFGFDGARVEARRLEHVHVLLPGGCECGELAMDALGRVFFRSVCSQQWQRYEPPDGGVWRGLRPGDPGEV